MLWMAITRAGKEQIITQNHAIISVIQLSQAEAQHRSWAADEYVSSSNLPAATMTCCTPAYGLGFGFSACAKELRLRR